MKASKSSIDSGSGSDGWGTGAACAGAGGGGAGVEMPDVADGGEAICWERAGTAWGSSIVEEAISSRRVVAASSLMTRLAHVLAFSAEIMIEVHCRRGPSCHSQAWPRSEV